MSGSKMSKSSTALIFALIIGIAVLAVVCAASFWTFNNKSDSTDDAVEDSEEINAVPVAAIPDDAVTMDELSVPAAYAADDVPKDVDEEPDEPLLIEPDAYVPAIPDEIPVTEIRLTTYDVSLYEGESKMPIVTMYPENAADKGEIWTTSDEQVASVDGLGLIKAVGIGKCTVTVTSVSSPDVKADVAVEVKERVYVPVEDISLSTYEVTLYAGSSKMPIVTMYPKNAADKSEIWTTSDDGVATVDSLGRITAVSEGNCTVTVTSADSPEVRAKVSVSVIPTQEAQGITYINGILVVNKTYALPSDYNPGVNSEAKSALDEMFEAAKNDGISLWVVSGFRSYETQKGLYNRYVNRDGKAEADRYSARPGHSEHQTGLAFDLNNASSSFAGTPEAKWIENNCYKYGFIVRYPSGKESITGFMYEPWHVRYLGKETAQTVYDSGLTLEEYLGIDSKYA